MPKIGKVNKNIIIKLYNEFQDINCDIIAIKTELLNIITTYCDLDNILYMCFDIDDYKISICKIYGLKITLGNDITYMFCIKTGNIYYASSIEEYMNTKKRVCRCLF